MSYHMMLHGEHKVAEAAHTPDGYTWVTTTTNVGSDAAHMKVDYFFHDLKTALHFALEMVRVVSNEMKRVGEWHDDPSTPFGKRSDPARDGLD